MRGLSYNDLVRACANVGVDLTCASCAAIFYTGTGAGDHTCALCRTKSLGEQIADAKEEVIRASHRFVDLRSQCESDGHGETIESPYGPRCAVCQHTYGWPCSADWNPTRFCQSELDGGAYCSYCRKPLYRSSSLAGG